MVRRSGRVVSGGDAMLLLEAILAGRRGWSRLWPPRKRQARREYEALAARRDQLSAKVPDVPPTVVEP